MLRARGEVERLYPHVKRQDPSWGEHTTQSSRYGTWILEGLK
ncbi:unnamed protein product [Chondrus crispus]|uniref:Uncharacterized protein n=1 Tax=Chondrus crispus TaxID=2769 RepID=R7QCQ2_CHOCR|nr:unnamed protein product [Chondrus crispus]CDF35211.1 unnamed protein product [Chondrus crispus]|eukprot:XP_005715030.1 unnamed protein product [Chondrus crispus]